MNHPIYRIRSFERVGTYMLKLDFDDGSYRTIDFEPILAGELFGPLRDPRLFAQVTLDPEVLTIVWPTGADFDPATLHDWPEHEPAFRAAAKHWASSMQSPDEPSLLKSKNRPG
jgi:hypothetical protein